MAKKNRLFKMFLGIDISKEKFDACCIDKSVEKLFRLSLLMEREGLDELNKKLSSLSVPKESILIGMESTACYHINLFSFLTSLGYTVVIINPLLISNFVKLQLRKTKTDKKDALVIAQFLLLNKDSLSERSLSSDISDMRDLSRQRESLIGQMTAIKNEMKRLLTITFSELEHIAGLFSKSILRLLCQYPSAYAIRKAKRTKIAKILIPGSYGKQTDESVERIRKAAETSIGTTSPMKEVILKQKASLLVQMEGHLQELTDILMQQCESTIQEDVDILTSIEGIGKKTATNFLIELGGDMNQFENHRKLIAMAGLDPAVYQSGKIDRKGKISKRGNRHLRRVIWLMATKVIQFNRIFKLYHAKRMKDGLPYKKAVLATAHKLVRVMFSMLTHKTLFIAKAN
ncbi:MAG: IS110 family transposase [Deltaproteobacteria bacterium]|nr:IS110 family transposase [Deltaproteobacteria bacterium]